MKTLQKRTVLLPFSLAFSISLLAPSTPTRALTITPIYDTSVTNSGVAASIMSGFAQAATYFQNTYSDPITVSIRVYWGAAGPFTSDPGTGGGASFANYTTGYSYNTVRTLLTNDVKSAADLTSFTSGNIGASNLSPLSSYGLPTAESKALNNAFSYSSTFMTFLNPYGATNGVDGWVSFGANTNWFFDQGSPVSSKYDFVGTAEHEISETLGRTTYLNQTNAFPFTLPFDLFRFSGVSNHTFNPNSGTAYFSYDNGATVSGSFNTVAANGDLNDWSSPTNDPYYYAAAKDLNVLSQADKDTLDVIGYDVVPEPAAASIAAVAVPTCLWLRRYYRRRQNEKCRFV